MNTAAVHIWRSDHRAGYCGRTVRVWAACMMGAAAVRLGIVTGGRDRGTIATVTTAATDGGLLLFAPFGSPILEPNLERKQWNQSVSGMK